MMKFNKINFGLLMLLFLCRFENILGTSDKNIEERLKEKFKIVDLEENILKNKKNENKKLETIYRKDIVKTKDGKVLVVKDSENENKVYLVLGIYDKNSKTANIFLDTNYKLQTSSPYDIEENNTIRVLMSTDEDCGGTLIQKEVHGSQYSLYEFQIVYCKLEDVKPDVILKELVDHSKKSMKQEDDFVVDSCCCDCLCN